MKTTQILLAPAILGFLTLGMVSAASAQASIDRIENGNLSVSRIIPGSGCTALLNPQAGQLQSGSACSAGERQKAQQIVNTYRREQGFLAQGNRDSFGQPLNAYSLQNACRVRVAEELGTRTSNVFFLSEGTVNAESGSETLYFRNTATGQNADCRVNTITGDILSVTLQSQHTSSHHSNPSSFGSSEPSALSKALSAIASLSFVKSCKVRVAEELGAPVRDIYYVNSDPIVQGRGSLLFRNSATSQRARCYINTQNKSILSVSISR
ncbi:MAG: hypothetical protein MH252_18225 [Thermosynechococcaceae cyanobacterium MS004]|nr:hypothetical protein [Thermosynechococcaceae cyanobacterium MS004]